MTKERGLKIPTKILNTDTEFPFLFKRSDDQFSMHTACARRAWFGRGR